MFILSNNRTGDIITRQEEPYYVCIWENGGWGKCSREEARAVSVNGNLYKLSTIDYGNEPLPEGNWVHEDPEDPESPIETAHVYVETLGTLMDQLFDDAKTGAENDEMHAAQIADIETAMCETTAAAEERIDAVEQAVCESSAQTEDSISIIENALCESSASTEERIAALEQALCELATALEG